MKEPLYLVDAYALIYRSYFAFINRPLFNPDGRNSSAVFGFFNTLLGFIKTYNPSYVGIILDSKTPTFRHRRYPEYKATREKAPEDLHAQVPVIEELLKEMGLPFIAKEGYEADDIIATFCEQCKSEKRKCYIMSGDKDLLQLVDDYTYVLKGDGGTYRHITVDEVKKKLGVLPSQIVDYLALIGDQSDNIPGVKGIGPKIAAALLEKYKTLDAIYENTEHCAPGQQKKLQENRDNAFLSRELVTLVKDLDLELNIDQLSIKQADFKAGVPIFMREGAKSLAAQAKDLSGPESAKQKQTPEKDLSAEDTREYTLNDLSAKDPQAYTLKKGETKYHIITNHQSLKEVIGKVQEHKWFVLDLETDSLNEMEAVPVGFALSVAAGEGYYIPLKAAGNRYLDEKIVKDAIKGLTTNPNLRMIGQNFKYDYKVLRRWGIEVHNLSFDTMVAAWLLDPNRGNYGMDSLAEKELGYQTIHYKDIVPKGSLFEDVDLEKAGQYSAEDADITYQLFVLYRDLLKKKDLERLFYTIEMPLIAILGEMELEGVRVVPERLQEYSKELQKDLDAIEKDIYKECGIEFNINSTQQLQVILFDKRKLKPIKKTKTGFSTDISVLEELAREDIVPALVLRHRTLSKLKSTYVDALPKLIQTETGRIHTHFIQTGTATGRLSSRDPNLQNIPIREEAGRRIRKAFVPAEGNYFLSADYAQIELVVLAHLSKDPELTAAFTTNEDVHRRTGALIFSIPQSEVTPEQRRIAKTINFGVMYGMSAFRLARELRISRPEAQHFIDAYFTRYSRIRSFVDNCIAEAESFGKVKTILGHERVINAINSKNRTERMGAQRIAVNTPIQGSAADIVKKGMLNVRTRLDRERKQSRMVLQIHDELLFEVPPEELESVKILVKEEMESAVTLDLPLRVSIETGKSWGELH